MSVDLGWLWSFFKVKGKGESQHDSGRSTRVFEEWKDGGLRLTAAFTPFDVLDEVFLRGIWVPDFFPASSWLGGKFGVFGNLLKGVCHVLTFPALSVGVVYEFVLVCFLAVSIGEQVLTRESGDLVVPT